MNALARIAQEITDHRRERADRAYHALCRAASEGLEITLSDHDLVCAISRALWNHQSATAQLGLTELEIRTAANAVPEYEEKAA